MKELKPIGKKYTEGDFRSGLQILHNLWKRLPEPKAEIPNAYNIIEYGVAFVLKMNDIVETWSWADHAPYFKEKRQDRGEVEFLIGKVAYEDGKLEIAKEQFQIAKRKSRGRMFIDEDPKYIAIISDNKFIQPNKRLQPTPASQPKLLEGHGEQFCFARAGFGPSLRNRTSS